MRATAAFLARLRAKADQLDRQARWARTDADRAAKRAFAAMCRERLAEADAR